MYEQLNMLTPAMRAALIVPAVVPLVSIAPVSVVIMMGADCVPSLFDQ